MTDICALSPCGDCGRARAPGDLCCEAQAAHQGRLHATCTHGPDTSHPGLMAIYEAAQEAELDRIIATGGVPMPGERRPTQTRY